MIKGFIGFVICAFAFILLFASGTELRQHRTYDDPWLDPLIWFVLSLALLLIGGSLLIL